MNSGKIAGVIMAGLMAAAGAATAQQAGPASSETRTLAKGSEIEVKTQEQISSQKNKLGDVIKAVVDDDVKDASGAVIFPEGSQAELEVVSTSAGLGLAIKSITSVGQTYRLRTGNDYLSGANQQPGGRNDSLGGMAAGKDTTSLQLGDTTRQANGARTWNIFKDNKEGLGKVSDVKEPAVGADFVVPLGTSVEFHFEEAVNISSS